MRKIISAILCSSIINTGLSMYCFAGDNDKKNQHSNAHISDLNRSAQRFGLEIVDVPGDGRCFFHAITHQLHQKGYTHINGQQITADYVQRISRQHMERNNIIYSQHLPLDGQGEGIDMVVLAQELESTIVYIDESGDSIVYKPANSKRTLIIGYTGDGNEGHYVSLTNEANNQLQELINNGEGLDTIKYNRGLNTDAPDLILGNNPEIVKVPHAHSNPHHTLSAISSATKHALGQRMNQLSQAAAGEEDEKPNGVWIGGFGGISTNKNIPDVKAKTNFAGFSVGYERFITENVALGAAISLVDGTVKYNSIKPNSDQKVSSKTYIGSIYGLANINDVILSGAVFAGTGTAKPNRQDGGENLRGKSNTTVYGAIAEVGYRIKYLNHFFTPSVSGQYSAMNQGKYTETGGNSAKSYNKRTSSILIGELAGKYEYRLETCQAIVIPSIKAGISRDFSLKSNNLNYKLETGEDSKFPIKSSKKKQTRFFANPGILVKSNSFEFSLNYTIETAKKFTGHIFGAKVMAKF